MASNNVEFPEWILRIKNARLFKAATYLASVNNACLALMKVESTNEGPFVAAFEIRMLSDALAELRQLHNND